MNDHGLFKLIIKVNNYNTFDMCVGYIYYLRCKKEELIEMKKSLSRERQTFLVYYYLFFNNSSNREVYIHS